MGIPILIFAEYIKFSCIKIHKVISKWIVTVTLLKSNNIKLYSSYTMGLWKLEVIKKINKNFNWLKCFNSFGLIFFLLT